VASLMRKRSCPPREKPSKSRGPLFVSFRALFVAGSLHVRRTASQPKRGIPKTSSESRSRARDGGVVGPKILVRPANSGPTWVEILLLCGPVCVVLGFLWFLFIFCCFFRVFGYIFFVVVFVLYVFCFLLGFLWFCLFFFFFFGFVFFWFFF